MSVGFSYSVVYMVLSLSIFTVVSRKLTEVSLTSKVNLILGIYVIEIIGELVWFISIRVMD